MQNKSIKYLFWPGLICLFYLSPNIYFFILKSGTADLYLSGNIIFHALISLIFLFLPVYIFKLSLRTYFFIISPYFLILPFVILSLVIFRRFPTPWIVLILLESDLHEVIEFMLGNKLFVFLSAVSLVIIFLIIYFKIPRLKLNGKKSNLIYSGLIVAVLVSIVLFHTRFFRSKNVKPKAMVSTVIKETPVKFLKTAVKTVSNKSRYNRLLKTRNNFSYHAWKKDTVNREIFVLLIGESSRYSNWQINGYDRNTSPLIMKKNVLSYSDVSSTSFLTSYSVMSMLTGEPFTDGVTVLKRKSFISAFKQCGFKVYWITDQPGMGSKPEFFINEADVVQKLECPQGRCYDEEVVQSMDKILKKNEPRILLILHTMGSHFEFYKRYPRQFDHFKPSWRGSLFTFSANKKKAMVINSYDNSILYTDYIISSVIDKISAKNTLSAVMYVSDHAENLYDYNNIFLPRAKAGYSQYLFHVPLFIWTSDLYKESFPEKFKVLQENRNQKISVDNIFSTILDMANIAYDGEDLTRSFADTTYTSEERKIYVGSDQVLVYDSLRSN